MKNNQVYGKCSYFLSVGWAYPWPCIGKLKKGKIPCKDALNSEEEGEEGKITKTVVSVFLNTVPNTPYRPQVTNVS